MEIVMQTKTGRYDARAEYDIETKATTVKKGSLVSPTVALKFRSSRSVDKKRDAFVKNRILMQDLQFKSPSSAANFVGGNSHNGYDDWRTTDGCTLRKYLESINRL